MPIDYQAQGQAKAQSDAEKRAAFSQWLYGQGIGDGSPDWVQRHLQGGGVDFLERNAKINQLSQQFEAQQAQPVIPDPSTTAPQVAYDFEGDVSKPGLMERYAQDTFDAEKAPSALEGYWNQNQGVFGPKGQGDQHWEGMQGGFEASKNLKNNAQDAYDSFNASVPADTSPYFDYATDRATREINSAAAGRGMLNSSGSLQQVADMQANLRGQQARENAAYGLNRAGLGAGMAAAADASGRSNLGAQQAWLTGAQDMEMSRVAAGAGIAGQVDQNRMMERLGLSNIYGAGQNAERARTNDYFGNQMNMGSAMAGAYQNIYGGAMGADQAAWEAAQNGQVAGAREAATASNNRAAQNTQNMGTVATIGNMFKPSPAQQQPFPSASGPTAPGTGIAGSGVKPKF